MMLMSHGARSAGLMGRPRPGVSATAGTAASAKGSAKASAAERNASLRVDMLDLPFGVDAPAGEAVVVLVREAERAFHRLLGLAALRDELGAQRLHVAGLVPGAA